MKLFLLLLIIVALSEARKVYPSGLDHPSYLDAGRRPRVSSTENSNCQALEDRYMDYISRLEEIAYNGATIERVDHDGNPTAGIQPKSVAQHLLSSLQGTHSTETAATDCDGLSAVISTSFSYAGMGKQFPEESNVSVRNDGPTACQTMFKRHATRNLRDANDRTYGNNMYVEGDVVVVKVLRKSAVDVMFMRFALPQNDQGTPRLLSVEEYTTLLN